MSALRSAICLALIIGSVLASSALAADPPRPAPAVPSRPASLAPVAGYWDDRFDMAFYERWSGSSGYIIHDAVIFKGDLYVAGQFSDNNPYDVDYALSTIARWDGRRWTSVGKWSNPVYSSAIYTMAVHDNSLYVGGYFSAAGGVPVANIARWDGANWHALSSGLGGPSARAFSLASWNGDLYVGGYFSAAGGVPAANVARWDGASWHAVGAGLSDDIDSAMVGVALKATPFGLYAGGYFNRSGAQEMHVLARWDGAQWSAAIPGLTGMVFSLDWHGGQLYAGGRFTLADAPEQIHNTLRWDGVQAELMTAGSNPQTIIRMVRSVDGELYAGFTTNLYRWEDGEWQAFGPPLDPAITSPISVIGMDIIAYNGQLHLFGAMEREAFASPIKFALALDGDEWRSLGQGVWARSSGFGTVSSVNVSGVALIDGDFYIAADTIRAGGKVMGNVARWDGVRWSSASIGPANFLSNAHITALLAAGSTLYAAGYEYDPALGRDRNFIVRRDAGVWTTLAHDVNGRVEALAWSNGVLYAGGSFTAVGTTLAQGVARWDGTTWSAMGVGSLYHVRALAVADGTVYAAGSTAANNPTPNAIARWSNGAWSSIANAEIYVLAISPIGDLYAGGYFTTIGGISANSIARWRNGAWEALGAGIIGSTFGPPVLALSFAPDGTLYAGGRFSQAGGVAVSNIARYDGQWSALGGGLSGSRFGGMVRYLAATAQGVYAGGEISAADGRISQNVAIWRPGAAPQAVADAATTERGQPVDIAVLANDTDADQDALTVTHLTAPTQGSAELIGGTVRYTPADDYVGSDSFGYTISDGAGGSATTMVTVSVSAPISSIFVPLVVK